MIIIDDGSTDKTHSIIKSYKDGRLVCTTEEVVFSKKRIMKPDLTDLTFVFPVKIDSLERLENIKIVTDYILDNLETNIIIYEVDYKKHSLLKSIINKNIKYYFIHNQQPLFHRTKILNQMTRQTCTPYVAVWDADVFVYYEQIVAAMILLRTQKATFVLPYDGRFWEIGLQNRQLLLNQIDTKSIDSILLDYKKMHLLYGSSACGGGFIVSKNEYVACGLENENFLYWGYEDGERIKRWEILGYPVARIKGPMLHLTHPRGVDSGVAPKEHTICSLKEYLRICKMERDELILEVSNWSRINNLNIV